MPGQNISATFLLGEFIQKKEMCVNDRVAGVLPVPSVITDT